MAPVCFALYFWRRNLSSDVEVAKRSGFLRALIGLCWFLLVNVVFVFGFAELVSLYSHSIAHGQEAIQLDRELSKNLGGAVWVAFLVISAILVARWTVIGFLPGTAKYK